MDLIKLVHQQLNPQPSFPDFKAGDNIVVSYKIIEKNLQQSLPVKAVTDKVLIAVTKKHVNNRYLVKYKSWKFLLIKSLPSAWVDKMIRKTLNQKSNIRPF